MMDPDVILSKIRVAIARNQLVELADLFNQLDEWLSKGGYLPEDWERWQNQK